MTNKSLLSWTNVAGPWILAYICASLCLPSSPAFAQTQTGKVILCEPTRSVNLIAPFVAQKEGIFKTEGLDVDVVQALSSVCIAGLASKTIDYTTTLGGDVMSAGMRGLPIRGVMAMHNGSDYGFLARQEIKDFNNLRGKAVGVSRVGSGADLAARFILEKNGLAAGKDVQISPLGSMEARVGALENGLIAAAIISMPAAFELEKKGYRPLVWGPDMAGLPFLNGITTMADKIKNRPDEVKKFIRSILKANKFIHEQREKTISFIMQWMRINPELARKSYEVALPGFTLTGEPRENVMKLILEQAKKDSGVTGEVPISVGADFSLLKEVQRDLGVSR